MSQLNSDQQSVERSQHDERVERRLAYRHPATELRTQLRTRRGFFGESWEEVSSQDFSRTGISVISSVALKDDASVLLCLELVLAMGSVTVAQLPGRVRHIKTIGRQFRYGIEFQIATAGSTGESLGTQLESLEDLVQRSDKVARRLRERRAPSREFGH